MSGLANTHPDSFRIPFAAGHTRRMPRLTSGPFLATGGMRTNSCGRRSATRLPLKQTVISASALSLMYPADDLPGYSR